MIKILNPWPEFIIDVKDIDKKLDVLIDGKKVTYKNKKKNQDLFIIFETDFDNHVVEIFAKFK